MVIHEHGSEFSGGGRVAKAAKDFTASAAASLQERVTAFGLVAQHPQVAVIVNDVRPFVLDIELPCPCSLNPQSTETDWLPGASTARVVLHDRQAIPRTSP